MTQFSVLFTRLLLLLALLASVVSCSNPEPVAPHFRSKLGRITKVSIDYGVRPLPTDHTSFGILEGGLLGSCIGNGGAANAVGALGGMIVGGLVGNSLDTRNADTLFRRIEVQVPDGDTIHLYQRCDRRKPAPKVGDRVVVEVDKNDTPVRVFAVAGASRW